MVALRHFLPGRPGLKTTVVLVAVAVAAGGAGFRYASLRDNDPLRRAERSANQGDLRTAQLELRNALRDNPRNARAHFVQGQVHMRLFDPIAAERDFKTARVLGMDPARVVPELGQSYMAQRNFDAVLREVRETGPTPAARARNLALRSHAQLSLNDLPSATESIAAAAALAPDDEEVLVGRARTAIAQKDAAQGDAILAHLLAEHPKQVEGLLMAAQIAADRRDLPAALALADRAVEAAPSVPMVRFERANYRMLGGQDTDARADVDAILALQPRNASAAYLGAVLAIRAGRYEDGARTLQGLGAALQQFPRAAYFQALAAINLGQASTALEFASRYSGRMPRDADGVRLLARCQLAAQRPGAALATLTAAVVAGQDDATTLDLLGAAYADLGQTAESVQAFQRAAAAAPGDAPILLHLAAAQMRAGDAVSAMAGLERTMALWPEAPGAAESLVTAALMVNDVDKAETALAALRRRSGETEATAILGGMIRLARFDMAGAAAAFTATLRQYPGSTVAKLNLAKVRELAGRPQDAEALLAEVLAQEPANAGAVSTEVRLLVQQKRYPAAIRVLEAARAAAPFNDGLAVGLSDVFVQSGDAGRAIAMLDQMRGRATLSPPLLTAFARAQAAAGRPREALDSYAAALLAAPGDVAARQAQVALLLDQKDVDGAKASLRAGLAASQGDPSLAQTLGDVARRGGGGAAALAMATELGADPALPGAAVLAGDMLREANRLPEAIEAYRAAFARTPTGALALRLAGASLLAGKTEDAAQVLHGWLERQPADVDAMLLLAETDAKAKRYPAAQAGLEAALQRRPGDPGIMNNLAWVYAMTGDGRARTLAQRAYLLSPTPDAADTLGWIMVQSGEQAAAIPLLQVATSARPDDASAQYRLSVALSATGRGSEAAALLRRALAGQAAFDERPEASALLQKIAAAD